MSRAVFVRKLGGPEVLSFEEITRRRSGAGRARDPPDGDRRQLHRHLPAHRALQGASCPSSAGRRASASSPRSAPASPVQGRRPRRLFGPERRLCRPSGCQGRPRGEGPGRPRRQGRRAARCSRARRPTTSSICTYAAEGRRDHPRPRRRRRHRLARRAVGERQGRPRHRHGRRSARRSPRPKRTAAPTSSTTRPASSRPRSRS